MSMRRTARIWLFSWALGFFFASSVSSAGDIERKGSRPLLKLLPEVEGWMLTEDPQSYFPENLYESIDGAAESYLSYDFQELLVTQFKKGGAETAISLEIYEMGSSLDAFGIYSTERSPENAPLNIGVQGYIDGDALNFYAGKNYIKLLCFDGGSDTAVFLERFARQVAERVGDLGSLPPLLAAFPRKGLIANSEKFVRRNVLGFDFLRNGYKAEYRLDGNDFDCFLIDTEKDQDARSLMNRLLDFFAKDASLQESIFPGHHLRTQSMKNMFLGISGRFLCAVLRIQNGAETTGEACLSELMNSLKTAT